MSGKIISYEIGYNKGDNKSEELHVEFSGLLNRMPKAATLVMASFGTFERTDNGTLFYTASIAREEDGTLSHDYDSELGDDLRSLKTGNVRIAY